MIDIEQVIKEVSKNTKTDKDLVSSICKHPFSYITQVMKDDEDVRDILLNGLFKFKLKKRFKENKTQKYSSK
jgi:nucleoid DNA-binding protein